MRILDVDEAAPSEAPRLTGHLIASEEARAVFVAASGGVIFTDRRILIVQREHLLEERIETISWSWREVRRFAIQEAASGEGHVSIRIWLGEEDHPLHLRANPGTEFGGLQALLVERLA
jgi:hypothetical protein